jgi:hypothetical protein
VSGQLHAPVTLPQGKKSPVHIGWGIWVNPRAGLDDLEKKKFFILPGLEQRPFDHQARSQSLYQLQVQNKWSFISRLTMYAWKVEKGFLFIFCF